MQQLGRVARGWVLPWSPLRQLQVRGARTRPRRRSKAVEGGSVPDVVELFQLPDHVLDLDAEDSRAVREFDERDGMEQEQKWGRNPELEAVKSRLVRPPDELLSTRDRLQRTRSRPWSPWRVNEGDVLSVALIGLSRPEGTMADWSTEAQYAELLQVAHHNAIPPQAFGDAARTTLYLLGELQSTKQQSCAPDDPSLFKQSILESSNLVEVRRILLGAVSSVQGREALAQSATQVSDHLRRLNELSVKNPPETLILLNNLSAKLASGDSSLPQPLCYLGLEVAASCSQFVAAQNYLALILRPNPAPPEQKNPVSKNTEGPSKSITSALSHIRNNILSIRAEPEQRYQTSQTRSLVAELLTLLTGRSLVYATAQLSIRDVILQGDDEYAQARRLYMWLLGELGAARTLWHESRGDLLKLSGGAEPSGPPINSGIYSRGSLRANSDATAMDAQIADRIRRFELDRAAGRIQCTGNYLDDVALDLEAASSGSGEPEAKARTILIQ